MGHPYDVERATDLHFAWCRALMEKTDLGTSHRAAPQMKAVMHELRRSLSPDDVITVANALPALERGIFLEGWSLSYTPVEIRDSSEFRERVFDRVKAHHARIDTLVEDVFWVWNKMLEPRKSDAIRQVLPAVLASMWPQGKSK
jgi:uncharacterized protein (DUF2267 family)